ncbi:MAG TPA: DUF2892 domain-containing protein [Longimicrobiales bacterium]|nr:DUF2892 domain-containing protein [Longimicrobiales bacterium]
MCDDRIIRRFAGTFILIGAALSWWHSPAWLLFVAFVGANLLQSSFTAFCPLERMLGRLGVAGCTPKHVEQQAEHSRAA